MTQLTIMLIAPERARADVLLREDRVYYRFATVDTGEDGDLPGLGDRFAAVASRILDALEPADSDKDAAPIPADELKLSVFVDNTARKLPPLTEPALRRLIAQITAISDSLAFINAFA